MKKRLLIIVLLLCSLKHHAQEFQTKFSVILPDSVAKHELAWSDLDNDGLLDVLVIASDKNGKQFLLTYKNDTTLGLLFKKSIPTNFKNASWVLSDTDLDNDIDILLSGDLAGVPTTSIFINDGNFAFSTKHVLDKAGRLRFCDLDQDGKEELMMTGVASGKPFLSIYQNKFGIWTVVHDSLKVNGTSIEIFDFDSDGDNDFFISGRNENSKIVSAVYFNQHNWYFKPVKLKPLADGSSAIADFNLDGNFDILLAGKDSLNNNVTQALFNHGNEFKSRDTLLTLSNNRIFAADFNSNGKCDVAFYGINASSDSVNLILHENGDFDTLNSTNLKAQAFGDFDHDGDLDLLQSIRAGSTLKLNILNNRTSVKNAFPGKPFNAVSAVIYNRLLLFWEKPTDDHTRSVSLTYDLSLQTSNDEWVASEFDLVLSKRLTVSRGNVGTKNYVLLKNAPGATNFAIQPIDNSFHAGSGICHGGPSCQKSEFEKLEVCKNEKITLTGTPQSLWFSISKGLLKKGETFQQESESSDTIFSVTPAQPCTLIKVYDIKVLDLLNKKTEQIKYACEGQQIKLGVEKGWNVVEWRNGANVLLSKNDSITYKVVKSDSITVHISNNIGCNIDRKTIIKISKPEIILNGETFQIMKGDEVQLNAQGTGEFLWTPPSGLNHSNVSDPVASPTVTTEYVVTLTDSIGCKAQAKVVVIVEGVAFVPNLFTPNDDGKNDDLRIYGLDEAKNFSFTIHNREGALVYETQNITQATSAGWDGSVNGTRQPNGVYYWKVKGELSTGKKLLLNGRSSGSIVLIR